VSGSVRADAPPPPPKPATPILKPAKPHKPGKSHEKEPLPESSNHKSVSANLEPASTESTSGSVAVLESPESKPIPPTTTAIATTVVAPVVAIEPFKADAPQPISGSRLPLNITEQPISHLTSIGDRLTELQQQVDAERKGRVAVEQQLMELKLALEVQSKESRTQFEQILSLLQPNNRNNVTHATKE